MNIIVGLTSMEYLDVQDMAFFLLKAIALLLSRGSILKLGTAVRQENKQYMNLAMMNMAVIVYISNYVH